MTYHRSGFVPRLTRWVSLVEQELLTLPEHLSSPMIFSGIRVTRSLVLYVCFVDRCLSFCTFSLGHCVVCSSSRYTDSDYPFGIFKLFLYLFCWTIYIHEDKTTKIGQFVHDLQPKGKFYAQNLSPFQEHYKSCKHSTDVRSSWCYI